MDFAPTVGWGLARRVSRASSGELPEISPRELTQFVASLRVLAREAGRIGARHMELPGAGAGEIRVVDWAGWGRAVQRMTDGAVDQLGLPEREPGLRTSARGVLNGLVAGTAIGKIGPQLLGQYDPFTGDDALYLVAPTILQHERTRGFVPEHFRLWIALHEQTHALQFQRAPWLREYLATRIQSMLTDDVPLLDGLKGWARSGDAAAILSGEGGAMADIKATMTFLEGHADHVADTAARMRIRTVRQLRKAFTRPERPGLLGRLSATFDKGAQYRDGLAFCTKVAGLKGNRGLRRAFDAPENLPTAAEIADPPVWIARVHG